MMTKKELLRLLKKYDNRVLPVAKELNVGRGKIKRLMNKYNIPIISTHGVRKKYQYSTRRLYNIYYKMMNRCYNPKNKDYPHYGGRGIEVCREWREDPDKFFIFCKDLDRNKTLTLDRINNSKGYFPDNVRFVTMKKQMNNTRKNRRLKYKDREYTLKELSEKYDVKYQRLLERLNRGWTLEDALFLPKAQ